MSALSSAGQSGGMPHSERETSTAAGGRAEPLLPWILRNLLLLTAYLLFASLVSMLFTTSVDDTPEPVVWTFFYYFFLGGLGCLPGLAIWLTILARLDRGRTGLERRLIAVLTSPLVGLFWLIFWATQDLEGFALVFGVFWPLGAGFVVKLRAPAPADSQSG